LKTKVSNNSPDALKIIGKNFLGICNSFDVAKWWKTDGAALWPLIGEGVACRYIGAPDTNAFQECVFSEVKNFFRPRRNRYGMAKFEAQVLLASNRERIKSVMAALKDTAPTMTVKVMAKKVSEWLMKTARLTAKPLDEINEDEDEMDLDLDQDEEEVLGELIDYLIETQESDS
jgi:hypothetical protein